MFTKHYDIAVEYAVEFMLPLPSSSPTKFIGQLEPIVDMLAFIYGKDQEEVQDDIVQAAKEADEDWEDDEEKQG